MKRKGPVSLSGLARAKINLSLRILGQRTDGYHLLESLVAFTDFGDRLALELGSTAPLGVEGPFAATLEPDNLVSQAERAFLERWPDARKGSFTLTKNLPIAAGIGGGSADAAAALNLLARANPDIMSEGVLPDLAITVGADVPVCLVSRACFMSGIGEKVKPLERFPIVHAVLANPGVVVSTQDVFDSLNAEAIEDETANGSSLPDEFTSLEDVVAFANQTGNDLTESAVAIAPVIGDVLESLAASPAALASALTGSGATCFALYGSRKDAEAAAGTLSEAHPQWWVHPVTLS